MSLIHRYSPVACQVAILMAATNRVGLLLSEEFRRPHLSPLRLALIVVYWVVAAVIAYTVRLL